MICSFIKKIDISNYSLLIQRDYSMMQNLKTEIDKSFIKLGCEDSFSLKNFGRLKKYVMGKAIVGLIIYDLKSSKQYTYTYLLTQLINLSETLSQSVKQNFIRFCSFDEELKENQI